MRLFQTSAAALLLAAIAAPAAAENRQDAALDAWVSAVEQKIEARIAAADLPLGQSTRGYTVVRFKRGADGLPAGAAVSKSSGSAMLDRAALDVVSGLGALPALPSAYPSSMPVSTRIVFADSDEAWAVNEAREQSDDMRSRQKRRNGKLAARYEKPVTLASN